MGASLPGRPSLFLAVSACCLVLAAPAAWCSWGADGVAVRATTDTIPEVAACTDGGSGTVVVWQENDGSGQGVLRAQHLLATGELDPAWPAEGAVACSVLAERPLLGAVPDRLGGAYVWWEEAATLFVKRVDSAGATATGWPDRGRALGTVFGESLAPCAIEDGANGIYLAWSDELHQRAVAVHLGTDNTGAGGWSDYARGLGLGGEAYGSKSYWPQLALAPDGGIFAAATIWSLDTTVTPSECRVRRLTSAGANASGWTTAGVTIGAFHRELWTLEDGTELPSLLALSPDDRGGVFILFGQPTEGYTNFVTSWLLRLQGDGTGASGWPLAGKKVDEFEISGGLGPIRSYQVTPDGLDGVVAGLTHFEWEYGPYYECKQYTSSGGLVGQFAYSSAECDLAIGPQGGTFAASYYPVAPYQKYDPDAYLAVDQFSAPAGWTGFREAPGGVWYRWYGDIGLAATDDGGCVLAWSQMHERFGLFARRFSSLGAVTAVEPPVAVPLALRGLRYVPGAGIRARISLDADGPVRLEVYDIAGRRLAGERFAGSAGTVERTVAGTGRLQAGVYFARLTAGFQSVSGRVVVLD